LTSIFFLPLSLAMLVLGVIAARADMAESRFPSPEAILAMAIGIGLLIAYVFRNFRSRPSDEP